MGQEIVYCQGCGVSLREGDFSQGRAQTIDHRPYCGACKPLPSPPPASAKRVKPPSSRSLPAESASGPPSTRLLAAPAGGRAKKGSTSRLPLLPLGAPRPAAPAPPRRAGAPLFAAGLAAGLMAVLILIVAASGSPRPAPQPSSTSLETAAGGPKESLPSRPPDRAAGDESPRRGERALKEAGLPRPKACAGQLDTLLTEIRSRIESDNRFEWKAEICSCISAAARAAGPRAGEVEKLRADYERDFDDAARRLADFARSEASRLAARQKYTEAIAKLEDYPPVFRDTRYAGEIRRLQEDLRRRAGVPPRD